MFWLLFNSTFWGGVLILCGLGMILNSMLGIKIPVFRIIIALLFIYFGFKMIFGDRYFIPSWNRYNSDSYSSFYYDIDKDRREQDINVSYGNGYVRIDKDDLNKNMNYDFNVNCNFGNLKIELDKDLPVRIHANAAFANVLMPDGYERHNYKSDNYDKSEYKVDIDASVSFGNLKFINY